MPEANDDWTEAQTEALAWLEANRAALSDDHMTIWDMHPGVVARHVLAPLTAQGWEITQARAAAYEKLSIFRASLRDFLK